MDFLKGHIFWSTSVEIPLLSNFSYCGSTVVKTSIHWWVISGYSSNGSKPRLENGYCCVQLGVQLTGSYDRSARCLYDMTDGLSFLTTKLSHSSVAAL